MNIQPIGAVGDMHLRRGKWNKEYRQPNCIEKRRHRQIEHTYIHTYYSRGHGSSMLTQGCQYACIRRHPMKPYFIPNLPHGLLDSSPNHTSGLTCKRHTKILPIYGLLDIPSQQGKEQMITY